MDNTSLYIIGNGFDLHHGMKTSYSNFREYLEEADRDLLDVIETYLYDDELWSSFEEALASLDIDSVLDNANSFLVSYAAEEWSDAYHHDYQYEINQIVESLSDKLKKAFATWIKTVEIPTKSQIVEKSLPLDTDAKYLNFNYTPTLERLYQISTSNITYIHGSITNKSKDLILGHAWNPKSNPPMISEKNPGDMDTRVIEGNDLINEYFSKTYKPTEKIIATNKSFFERLDSVREIYIFGHSLSAVDIPYFEAIVEHVNLSEVQWTISYRSKDKKHDYTETLKSFGIVSSNIKFIKLDELSSGAF